MTQEQINQVREALKPFASEAEARHWIAPECLDDPIGGSGLTNADLIRAYDALSLLTQPATHKLLCMPDKEAQE